MLRSLQIRNFALIDNLELTFDKGLNIITGETGAGKSIIVDALMVALGERATLDLIRQGESKAIIEAIFSAGKNQNVKLFLDDNGIDVFDELILRRELSLRGNSRCFINDSPVPVNLLKKLGDLLVDFHGQHDHQTLLHPETHLEILDSIGNYKFLLECCAQSYYELKLLLNKKRELLHKKQRLLNELESRKSRIEEINRIDPRHGEDEELELQLTLFENSEQIFNLSQELSGLLYDNDDSLIVNINRGLKYLNQLKEFDKQFQPFYNEFEQVNVTVDEIAKFIKDYTRKLSFDPDQIESIRQRLVQLKSLRKKFGSINNVLEEKEVLEQEIKDLENIDNELQLANEDVMRVRQAAGEYSVSLSEKRATLAETFSREIESILTLLGIPNAKFEVNLARSISDDHEEGLFVEIGKERYILSDRGIDLAEFLISANKGEPVKPLSSIASGGEISRVMLSIKSILASKDTIPTMVFDEIDIGISGRIAQKVGFVMKEIAANHQIIAITHLPQIAALGAKNIRVYKIDTEERTTINISELNNKEKVQEVARLLSGEIISDASLKSARELVQAKNTN